MISPVCPCRILRQVPSRTSPRRTVSSSPLVTRSVPSGLKATAHTGPMCPYRMLRQVPSRASQRRMVSSIPLVARSVPSGLKATDLTHLSWPCKILRHRPACPLPPPPTPHSFPLPSYPPLPSPLLPP